MKQLFIILILVQAIGVLQAQQVNNIIAEKDGDYVKITYDLSAGSPSEMFEVQLYGSHNNFTTPLRSVSGDIGKNIKPGEDKIIIWRPMEELTTFTGEIIFEIRATLLTGYYQVTNPTSASKFKKKRVVPVKWKGGQSDEEVTLEVVKFGSPVLLIAEKLSNSGSYNWTIPKDFDKGAGYQVKVTNSADQALAGTSNVFRIAGGIPPWIMVGVPVVVGGAVVGVLMSGGEEPTDPVNPTNGETDTDLPLPPDGPSN